jgi:hypothetical protein
VSGVEVRLFAEADHLEIQHRVNDFLRKNDVEYIGHCYIADGLDKPYNLSLVYRQKRKPWWKRFW